MKRQTEEINHAKTIAVVRRVDVLMMLMVIALMIVFYHWAVTLRQLQYEKQVNAELTRTKAELAEVLAVYKVDLNRRIGLIEQIIVDKQYIDNWGEFIKEIEHYRSVAPGSAKINKGKIGSKLDTGDATVQVSYVKKTY